MDQVILQTQDVEKTFQVAGGELTVLRGIGVSLPKGRLIIIKGRSGSGKTTLLNILSALDTATGGEITFSGGETGQDIIYSTLSDKERDRLRRRHMGFVFQSVALIPIMTAYENVDFGLRAAGYKGSRDKRIKEVLSAVGLEQRMQHMPSQLSGGEQQRVAVARAMAHMPEIIFADEPTGALDTAAGLSVTQLFKELAHREGITVVMTTHDAGLMELGDVVYEIEDGVIRSEQASGVRE